MDQNMWFCYNFLRKGFCEDVYMEWGIKLSVLYPLEKSIYPLITGTYIPFCTFYKVVIVGSWIDGGPGCQAGPEPACCLWSLSRVPDLGWAPAAPQSERSTLSHFSDPAGPFESFNELTLVHSERNEVHNVSDCEFLHCVRSSWKCIFCGTFFFFTLVCPDPH